MTVAEVAEAEDGEPKQLRPQIQMHLLRHHHYHHQCLSPLCPRLLLPAAV
jgi:hypothetical protein